MDTFCRLSGLWLHVALFSLLLCPSNIRCLGLPGFKPLSSLGSSVPYLGSPACITFGIFFKGHNLCNFSSHIMCLPSFRDHCFAWCLPSSKTLFHIFCLVFCCFTKEVKCIPCYSISWSRSSSPPNSDVTLCKDTTFRLILVPVSQILWNKKEYYILNLCHIGRGTK